MADQQKRPEKREPKEDEEEIIRLEDLAPPGDVKGGAGRILFGEEVVEREPKDGERE